MCFLLLQNPPEKTGEPRMYDLLYDISIIGEALVSYILSEPRHLLCFFGLAPGIKPRGPSVC
jgi:hypothetical protein